MSQEILCSVISCQYNEQGKNKCSLPSIQVPPNLHASDGAPESETNCASYTKKI